MTWPWPYTSRCRPRAPIPTRISAHLASAASSVIAIMDLGVHVVQPQGLDPTGGVAARRLWVHGSVGRERLQVWGQLVQVKRDKGERHRRRNAYTVRCCTLYR